MRKTYFLFAFFAIAATFLVRNNPFFWDTVQLASKHGPVFFDTHFSSLILPEEIDSGHIPTFGLYMALCWEIFGKTLAVSHFAMLPFLLSIGYFLLKIGSFLAGEKKAAWLLFICFADPVLMSQSLLVSPDVVLVCFLLMGLYAVWIKKTDGLLMLAVIGLGLTSMRGMMVAIGLFVFSFAAIPTNVKSNGAVQSISAGQVAVFFRKLIPFLPGGIMAACYLFYHWQQTGWIGHHAGSPWAPSFERVGFQGFIKNIAVFGWRMLDFGRVFTFLAALFFVKEIFRKGAFVKRPLLKELLLLVLIILVTTIPTQLMYSGLLAHRYFLPLFICLHLLLFFLLFESSKPLNFGLSSKWLAGLVIVGLFTGNLWVYPKKISQGWDSTMAHLPWYDLIGTAQQYLKGEEIPFEQVGTAFPNIGPREWYELDGRLEGFVEKDFKKDCFILYSNIMNDFSDEEIDELETNWQPVYHQERMGVCLIIYKNPEFKECGN